MRYDQRFSNIRLCIEYVAPSALVAAQHNPRVYGARQIKALAKSIDAFGFVAPVIADENNVLIAGDARVEAAKRVGLAEVPVVRVEYLRRAPEACPDDCRQPAYRHVELG